MGISRWSSHLNTSTLRLRRRFDAAAMERIAAAIAAAERGHAGEIRFAVEAALPLRALLHRVDARSRALHLFSQLRVWDTAGNTGVLLYLLWADQAIEIVVDRGIAASIPETMWRKPCDELRDALRRGDDADAAVCACIGTIGAMLRAVLPPSDSAGDELPDAPILL